MVAGMEGKARQGSSRQEAPDAPSRYAFWEMAGIRRQPHHKVLALMGASA